MQIQVRWLVCWLVLLGMVAGCLPDQVANPTPEPALELDGPALIFFYTDN